jgi:hypothetical protein
MSRSLGPILLALCVTAACEPPPAAPAAALRPNEDPILQAQCPAGATAYGAEPPVAYLLECRRPDGTPHGISRTWFPNGGRQRLGRHDEGQRVGSWTDFHRNGKMKSQGRYAHDLRDGVWTFWHKSGRLEERTWFRAGQIETWDTKSLDP